uniref:Cytochrome oxidase n=1 Tax=Schlesneria paludicola TaxID=360056 RepID=A0A7C2NU93_9PLAN
MTASHTVSDVELPRHEDLVEERLVLWYFVAALTYMLISMTGGLVMGLQLLRHNPLPVVELLSPGRWRMVHTNAIAYGFIANAFLGIMHWVIPRLTLQPVLSRPLSYAIFAAWQGVVVATAVGLILGEAQGLEWGETPVWIDPIAQAGLLLVAINFGAPILKVRGPLYVTLWYYLAALVWTFLTYAMGNFVPEYFVCGSSAGAVGGLFIHDLVGLFVTPLGWGMMYYFVPILLKRPMWSHGLSLVGFWGLAFFYPLQGIHHFLYTPIPMFLQYGAILSTIALELVVVTVIINFLGTLSGTGTAVVRNLPLRYFYTGILFYFLTCLQCALQTTLTFQALIHFTDWVVGHAHMVMFGVFSLWQLGAMTYLIPRILKTEWYSAEWCEWHYWASAGGLLVMAGDLILGGLFQGWSWAALQPWESSVQVSIPFWSVRIVAGLVMFAAQLLFVWNFYKTWQKSRSTAALAAQ